MFQNIIEQALRREFKQVSFTESAPFSGEKSTNPLVLAEFKLKMRADLMGFVILDLLISHET